MRLMWSILDQLLGKPVVLTITGTCVRICADRKSLEYELPGTFQDYNYIKHVEEMSGWLQAVLLEKKIRIRQCRIVLDTGQAFLQTVKLPSLTAQEQKNWVRWEGSQYVPFEPGTYQAVILPRPEPVAEGNMQESQEAGALAFSSEWKTEESSLIDFLLVAVPLEQIASLQKLCMFLKAELKGISVEEPKQGELPIDLLPAVSKQEALLKRCYKTAAGICLFLSLFLAVRAGICWQRAKCVHAEAERQLMPYRSVKTAYEEGRQTDYRIQNYRQSLKYVNQADPIWSLAFQTIGQTIPEGCWLVGLQQKRSAQLEIKGYALALTHVTDFLKRLERSGAFSEVHIAESGGKRITVKEGEENGKRVISFLFLAELAPVQEEGMP